ncbi:MAG: 30S ribosomal protein S9 [Phycisphaerales bacterium]|nr:MAG: 30S ribosomal protein S9 [Phycisphaerales bacterium]UCF17982.1 MAG: 30S ribosomal protein S9 [Phycisphaerales bacterium]
MTETPTEPVAESKPKIAPKPQTESKGGYWWGTGRRKSSVARVRIKPGSGKLVVNKKELADYFKRSQDRNAVTAPLKAVEAEKLFDVFINVKGGGTTGQSGASLLGIARALKQYDDSYVQALRDGGHLTRDPRMVERKKPGQRGARRRFQFSKR